MDVTGQPSSEAKRVHPDPTGDIPGAKRRRAHLLRFLTPPVISGATMDVVDDINKNAVDTSKILDKFDKACSITLTTEVGLDLYADIDKVIQDFCLKKSEKG